MAIRVQIPAPLRSLTGGTDEVQVEAKDVASLVAARLPYMRACATNGDRTESR